MVLPALPLIIGGVGLAGGALGGWWLSRNNKPSSVQDQAVTQYFDNRAYVENYQYATQYFLAPVESASLTQSNATAIKQEQQAGNIGQETGEQGFLTSSNLNTALIVAGVVVAGYFVVKGVSK